MINEGVILEQPLPSARFTRLLGDLPVIRVPVLNSSSRAWFNGSQPANLAALLL